MSSKFDYPIKWKAEELTDDEKYIQSLDGTWRLGTYSTSMKGVQVLRRPGYGCHAGLFHMRKKQDHLVTQYQGDSKEACAFLDWMMEPEGFLKNIWKYKEHAVIYDKNGKRPTAISLGENQSMIDDWGLIMTLCIMSRVPTERDQQMKTWYKLVTDWSLDKALAYYMSKFITASSVHKDSYSTSGAKWTGGHEIFVEGSSYYTAKDLVVDVKRFASGDHYPSNHEYLTSVIWAFPKKPLGAQHGNQFPFEMYSKVMPPVPGQFGSMRVISPEMMPKVIEDFKKFVEKRYEKA